MLLAAAAPALADGPELLPDGTWVVRLKAGETMNLGGGAGPICDDPKVAAISADGRAILSAVGPGQTLCSMWTSSQRTIIKVIVQR